MTPLGTTGRGVPFATAVILTVATLDLGRELLIPLTLAVFLTFLLLPSVRAMERLRIGRTLATGLVVLSSVTLLAAGGWIVIAQGADLIENYPRYRENILNKIRDLREAQPGTIAAASLAVEEISAEMAKPVPAAPSSQPAADPNQSPSSAPAKPASVKNSSDKPLAADEGEPLAADEDEPLAAEEDEPPVKVEIVAPREELIGRALTHLFGPVMYPVATIGVSIMFVVFFLIYGDDLHHRLLIVLSRAGMEVEPTALAEAGARVMRYVSALGLVNALNGVAIAVGLFALGLPNYLLWGVLSAFLRFIPVIGTWIGVLFPGLVAVAMFDGWFQPAMVVALIIGVDFVSFNLCEPWLFGTRTGASPTAILFAYVFWTWLWGGVGLFLAAPITVCLIALGRRVPALAPLSILLGDEAVPPETGQNSLHLE